MQAAQSSVLRRVASFRGEALTTSASAEGQAVDARLDEPDVVDAALPGD
jgi:hypothetical protein